MSGDLGPAPRRRPSIDVASIASGSAAALDSIAETGSAADSGAVLAPGSGRSSLDVDPAAGAVAAGSGAGGGATRSSLGGTPGAPRA